MKKLPIFQTTKAAYTFIFSNTRNILPLFAQYSSSMILLYLFLHFEKDYLTFSSQEMINIPSLLIFFAFTMVATWLQLPLTISIVRATVKQEALRKNYFNLLMTARTGKAFLTMILTSLLSLGSLTGIIALGVGLISILSLLNLQKTLFDISSFVLIIMGLSLVFSVLLRISLAIPNAALDHSHPIKLSWRVLKGLSTRLSIIMLFTLLPSIAWSLGINFIFDISLLQTNPLAYGFLSLPQLYLGLAFYAGLGEVYKHLNS